MRPDERACIFIFQRTKESAEDFVFRWRGRLHWPSGDAEQGKVVLSREEFALLVGGIDLAQTSKRKWYRKPVGEEPNMSRMTA